MKRNVQIDLLKGLGILSVVFAPDYHSANKSRLFRTPILSSGDARADRGPAGPCSPLCINEFLCNSAGLHGDP